jgi:hypothetical protein
VEQYNKWELKHRNRKDNKTCHNKKQKQKNRNTKTGSKKPAASLIAPYNPWVSTSIHRA